MSHEIIPSSPQALAKATDHLPVLIEEAGSNAGYAYEGFLFGEIENQNTRTA